MAADDMKEKAKAKKVKLPSKIGFLPKFDDTPIAGTIGQFNANRAMPWDSFVIVTARDQKNCMDVIFPRIVWRAGKLCIGPDKLQEYVAKCTCTISQGCDFRCNCGAEEKNVEAYAKSFQEVNRDTYEYEVVPLDLTILGDYVFLDYPSSDKELAVDLPMQHGFCVQCRSMHA
jgi:hypothetical protein